MTAPRILVIDDNRTFRFPADYARTSDEGLELLRNWEWDEVWLDHDLGGDDTIMPVVEELERSAFYGRPLTEATIIVHSANPVGAARIQAALQRFYQVHVVDAARWVKRDAEG